MTPGISPEDRMAPERVPEFFRGLRSQWQDRKPAGVLAAHDGVVLAGAGKVGQQFLAALRASRIEVLAFSDNNPARWGSVIADVPVISPDEAAARFGRRAVFIVTVGAIGAAAADLCRQYAARGARTVLYFTDAIREVPRLWPEFFVNPDELRDEDAQRAGDMFALLADAESRRHFLTHLRWRMTLDPSALETPDYTRQYFPGGVISPQHCGVFVDVGAYTGDTLLAVAEFAGASLREYDGFEPDPANYAVLESHAKAMRAARPDARIGTRLTAVGSRVGTIAFAGTGAATSQVHEQGNVQVPCSTLDALAPAQATYLKIDVEGAERDVFSGGADWLARWKPTVAVASYHRPRDLFELPLWLADVASDYRFYLRSHGDAGVDLVCYAVREGSR